MDEVEDFPDDLAYDSDEEEYDALNDETFGSDAIGDEDWEQSHEALAGLSQEQNELEARLATLWQDEDNVPQVFRIGMGKTASLGEQEQSVTAPPLDLFLLPAPF
ncbi:unnamed protein product, partial [Timema podura]|nr:unnamed protein product [Timema podura]